MRGLCTTVDVFRLRMMIMMMSVVKFYTLKENMLKS